MWVQVCARVARDKNLMMVVAMNKGVAMMHSRYNYKWDYFILVIDFHGCIR